MYIPQYMCPPIRIVNFNSNKTFILACFLKSFKQFVIFKLPKITFIIRRSRIVIFSCKISSFQKRSIFPLVAPPLLHLISMVIFDFNPLRQLACDSFAIYSAFQQSHFSTLQPPSHWVSFLLTFLKNLIPTKEFSDLIQSGRSLKFGELCFLINRKGSLFEP